MHINVRVNVGKNKYDTGNETSLVIETDSINIHSLFDVVRSVVESAMQRYNAEQPLEVPEIEPPVLYPAPPRDPNIL